MKFTIFVLMIISIVFWVQLKKCKEEVLLYKDLYYEVSEYEDKYYRSQDASDEANSNIEDAKFSLGSSYEDMEWALFNTDTLLA